jgi:hypothetical protein
VDCSKIRELVDDYVFGLLEATQERDFKTHVESCEACASLLAEAQSRKKTLSAWTAPPVEGAAERLLARIRSEKLTVRDRSGPLVVRILAAAAVILAAVVLPMLFMTQQPEVLGYQPSMTSVTSKFQKHVAQEFNIPPDGAGSACIVVRLVSADSKIPLRASASLNDGQPIEMTGTRDQNEQVVILTQQHGLKDGPNLLNMENMGSAQVEFELTLVVGASH